MHSSVSVLTAATAGCQLLRVSYGTLTPGKSVVRADMVNHISSWKNYPDSLSERMRTICDLLLANAGSHLLRACIPSTCLSGKTAAPQFRCLLRRPPRRGSKKQRASVHGY